ncbi:endoribonuclease L-PSP protein (plasmid) [Rhizobium gallicum]|uniref:Endoribonuclease L-PSP protein n=1 Tax=Rhizobium gallicum TaxID=56730 RepID=A0A1L5NPM3_9HYPH|nr:endoribonuclease L-PSP protein [Rhizobium gallicum]
MGYSQVAVVAAGKLGFISGQVGIDTEWRLAPTFQQQTVRAFGNLKAAVEACGATMANVCKLTIFAVGDVDSKRIRLFVTPFLQGSPPCRPAASYASPDCTARTL